MELEARVAELCAEVMAAMPSGVAVMTLVDDAGGLHGMTISSLTPVSSEPPSVLMCVGGSASSRPFLIEGQRLCANILAADQAAHSMGFAFGDDDPFEVFEWSSDEDGTPILANTAAHLLCEVERVVDYHETAVVLAAVRGGSVDKDETLVYRNKSYFGDLIPVTSGAKGQW